MALSVAMGTEFTVEERLRRCECAVSLMADFGALATTGDDLLAASDSFACVGHSRTQRVICAPCATPPAAALNLTVRHGRPARR
jgi:hypothetical protein